MTNNTISMDNNMKAKLLESFLGNFTTLLLNLVFPLLITRIYGQLILGKYTYNLALMTMGIFLATLGMNTGLLYFIPRIGKKYILSSFIISMTFSSLISLIGLFLVEDYHTKIMIPLLILVSLEQMFFALYRVNQQIKEYYLVNLLVGNGTKILLALLLAFLYGPSIEMLILATYSGFLIEIIMFTFKQKNMFQGFHFSRELISYSIPISLSTVMLLVMMQMDKIMIGNMIGKEAVAMYSVPSTIANFPSIFLTTLNTVFPPIVAKLYHDKKFIRLRDLYQKSVFYLIAISSVAVLIIVVFRYQILSLYGQVYLAGSMVLIMVSIGQLVNAGVGSVWYIVIMTGYGRLNLIVKTIALMMNLTLNAILIPRYGINGAAFATMITTVFNNMIGFFLVKKILNDSVSRT